MKYISIELNPQELRILMYALMNVDMDETIPKKELHKKIYERYQELINNEQ